MAKNDAGHAKNVSNFYTLTTYCMGYGPRYSPSRIGMKLTNLHNVQDNAQAALNLVSTTRATLKKATDLRYDSFMALPKLATRAVNSLAAADVNKGIVTAARSLLKKIRGQRIKALKETDVDEANSTAPSEADEQKHISTSRRSYDNLLEHLGDLISLLGQEDGYDPNENDLTVEGLQTLRDNMLALHNAAIDKYTAWSNARMQRDRVLYADSTGLVPLALNVKRYVKSVYGARSEEYKQISGIKFHNQVFKSEGIPVPQPA